jgi:hypothetical protein
LESVGAGRRTAAESSTRPPSPQGDDLDARSPFAGANEVFREAYAEARDAATKRIPILIVLGEELILCHGATRRSWRFAPTAFHELKVAAHVLVATNALLALASDSTAPEQGASRLRLLLRALRSSGGGAEPTAPRVREAIELCIPRIETALGEAAPAPANRDVDAQVHALLASLTDEAARVRLASLHRCVEEALALLGEAARRDLRVVVAGDHQARRRSLGMQYFQRRLPAEQGEADRVAYGESVTTEAEAVALVGTSIVDRALAEKMFGDPTRLQEDVLGDATKTQLDAMSLAPIAR